MLSTIRDLRARHCILRGIATAIDLIRCHLAFLCAAVAVMTSITQVLRTSRSILRARENWRKSRR